MKGLFFWLDGHPAIHGVLGGLVVLWTLIYCWMCRRRASDPSRAERVNARLLLLLLLLAWRWPALLEINSAGVDEAQLISSAHAMAHDPLPFRAADPGGNGLVAAVLLLPAHWCGLPPDYFVARLLGLLGDWGALVLLHGAMRRVLGDARALLALLPLTLVLAMPQIPALYEYRSWHATFLFAALAGRCLLWCAETAPPVSRAAIRWLLAGGCLAALPWTSRGGVGVAVGIGVATILIARRRAGPETVRRLWYAGGWALYCLAAFLCFLHGVEQWTRAWAGYISGQAVMNLPEASPLPWAFGIGSIVAVGAFGCAAWIIGRPARGGVGLLLALAAGAWLTQALAGAPAIVGHFSEYWRRPYSELGTRLRALRQADDRLVVWGVRPQLYIEAGLRPPVSSSVTSGEMRETNPWKDAYRARFLAELIAQKPAFFVDAGAPGVAGYAARAQSGHEVFFALREHVENYFRMVSDDGQARLYLRHARDTITASDETRSFPVELAKVTVLQATGGLTEIDEGRWFAHAPSRFSCPQPQRATYVQGKYGFLDSAYGNHDTNTDGATFIVEALAEDGSRVRLLERKLNPVGNPDDRGQISFRVEVPHGKSRQIQFIIESGPNTANDWTYWGRLEFGR